MRSAGFTDVECQVMQMPMCAWPTGEDKPAPFAVKKAVSIRAFTKQETL